MKKLYFLLAITFAISTTVQSQTELEHQAPTLQIGLDGMSFGKGTLDAQLIMEIIAEKQQELKVKAVQNVFLSKVENSGGTVYSFTNNVVRELLLEKDDAVRTKKILENTVNLVFVTAYLEYYLQSLKNDKRNEFLALAKDISCDENFSSDKPISLSALNVFKNRNITENNYKADNKESVAFMALLIDMASEAVRQDKKLKQLGLMQISYSATYEYMNRYKNKYHPFKPTDTIKIKEFYPKVDTIYSNMVDELKKVTDNIGLVNYIVEHFSFRNDKLAVFGQTALDKKALVSTDTVKTDLKSFLPELNQKVENLIKEMISVGEMTPERKDEINNLTSIYFYLDKAIKQMSNFDNSSITADVLYTIYREFIPVLKKQSYGNVQYLNIIADLDVSCAKLAVLLLKNNKTVFNTENGTVNDFFLLASKLYEFDKANTFSEYMKLIEDIGYIFPDEDIKSSLSTIVSFVKDYTAIGTDNEGKEVINFNVESFIVKLQNIKSYKHSRWQFHFTVGLNNAYFNNKLTLKDGSVIRNLSYVSEKIGVKYKIKDWGFYYSRNPGETYSMTGKNPFKRSVFTKTAPPKEPLVSNLHIVAYGSGLLYNLVNAKTNSEFNMPLVGAGLGVTFSNALDFNLSIGVPLFSDKSIKTSFDYPFINFGFDIQFIEYYNRLTAKRNANKTQKRLGEAISK